MTVKTSRQGNSIVIPIPVSFNIGENVEYQPSIDKNGVIRLTPVNQNIFKADMTYDLRKAIYIESRARHEYGWPYFVSWQYVSASVGNQGLCVQSKHTTDCASADFWNCAGNVWHYRKIDLILTETNQTDCNHQKLMVAVCFNGASTHDYRLS